MWYGNLSNQDCTALQRVVCLAEHISGSALPSLQDICLKRSKTRAAKIIMDSNPGYPIWRCSVQSTLGWLRSNCAFIYFFKVFLLSLFTCITYSFFLIFILFLPILYIVSCVMFLFFMHCPLSGPVLIYISLLIISCIIEYVTNKRTLNLDLDPLKQGSQTHDPGAN